MYIYCIVIPSWKGELSCLEYKRVYRNCQRASQAALCIYSKHWTNNLKEKNNPELLFVQNIYKQKDIESQSLQPDVKQPGKYSK